MKLRRAIWKASRSIAGYIWHRRTPFSLLAFLIGFIAFCLWAYFSIQSYSTEYAQYREGQAEQESSDSEEQHQTTCRIIPLSLTIECIENSAPSNQQANYAYEDLQAQQDMSVWAYGMLLVSVAMLVVTAAGVIYVALTLKATNVANSINKKIAEAEDPRLRISLYNQEGSARPSRMWIENIGRSAANVTGTKRLWVFSDEPPKPLETPGEQDGLVGWVHGKPTDIASLFRPNPERDKANPMAYIYGWLRYENASKDEWVQYFCLHRRVLDNGAFSVYGGNENDRDSAKQLNRLEQTKSAGVVIKPANHDAPPS